MDEKQQQGRMCRPLKKKIDATYSGKDYPLAIEKGPKVKLVNGIEIVLHDHQFWITGDARFHAPCLYPVYGDDQGNRFCTKKNCMHSKFSINPMEDLVVDHENYIEG